MTNRVLVLSKVGGVGYSILQVRADLLGELEHAREKKKKKKKKIMMKKMMMMVEMRKTILM